MHRIPQKKESILVESGTHALFMSKIERSHDDEGIMNLGKNCEFCQQLDFLPFHCELCNGTFCGKHRALDVHECVGRPQKTSQSSEKNVEKNVEKNLNKNSNKNSNKSSSKTTDGSVSPTAASLFPDRAKHSQLLDAQLKQSQAKPKSKNTPLIKLTKFLHFQRIKRQSEKKKIKVKSIFNKSPSATSELLQIQKDAKGPNAVKVSDRIYVWVLFVNKNEEEFDKISVEKERKAIWISKNWSVGRALDSIAETMNIINYNNSTQNSEQRLNLFIVKKEEPVILPASVKVGATITNASTLYLVKGAM